MSKQIPKPLTDMHEKIMDVCENLSAIKGKKYAHAAFLCFLAAHTTRMIGSILQHLPEDMAEAREAAGHQLAYTLAKHMSFTVDNAEFSDADVQELMKWSDTMQSYVEQAIKEST